MDYSTFKQATLNMSEFWSKIVCAANLLEFLLFIIKVQYTLASFAGWQHGLVQTGTCLLVSSIEMYVQSDSLVTLYAKVHFLVFMLP